MTNFEFFVGNYSAAATTTTTTAIVAVIVVSMLTLATALEIFE